MRGGISIMRLIDADELINEAWSLDLETSYDNQKVVDMIEDATTINLPCDVGDKVLYTEICRGKCKDGKWVEGYYIKTRNYLDDSIVHLIVGLNSTLYPREEIAGTYEVIFETIGRYIGITDKNKRKIFDGDIVKTKYGRTCKIVWLSTQNCQCWDLIPLESKHPAPDEYDLWDSKNLEVIGNIYDSK